MFYRSSSPFLHFHGKGADLVCDLEGGAGWLRYPAGTTKQQRVVIADARKVLKGRNEGLRGLPT